jgi:hypothetical protein
MPPVRARVPALLLVALVLDALPDASGVGLRMFLGDVFYDADGPWAWLRRVQVIDTARSVVIGAALTAGMVALAGHLAGWQRRAATVAAVGFGVSVGVRAALLAIQYLVDSPIEVIRPGSLGHLAWQGVMVASVIGWTAALIATGRRARWLLTAAGLAALALRSPLYGVVIAALADHPGALLAVDVALSAALPLVLLASTVSAVTGPGAADRGAAHLGIHQVGSALIARVIIAASTVPSAMIAVGVQSPKVVSLLALLLPTAAAVATIVLATGAVRASRWSVDGAPRLRFAAAGLLVAIGAVGQLVVIATLRNHLRDAGGASSLATIQSMEWILPVVDVTGLLVLASALAASARLIAGDALARRISQAVVALVACMGVATWILRSVGTVDRGTWVVVSIVAAVTTAIATLVLARRTHELSAAFAAAPVAEMPAAIAKTRDDQEP